MAAANKNTVVVVTSGGNFDMQGWLAVPALVEAWYPGQEGGTALAEILFGDTNPSGRLPATFEKRLEDNPAFTTTTTRSRAPGDRLPGGRLRRLPWLREERRHAEFPFGYGLSYTTFKYGGLAVTPEKTTTATWRLVRRHEHRDARRRRRRAVYVGDGHARCPVRRRS